MARNNEGQLTPALIEELKSKGYNQSQIAEMYGVTRQYVSLLKHSTGTYAKTPRERAMEAFPWKFGVKFHDAWPARCLSDHMEYMATGGRGMSEYKLKRLGRFYDFLERNNTVVEFDPNLPPTENVATGGFAYRPRVDGDGDLLIRVNEHTELSEDGRRLLRFPPRKPGATKG